MFIKSLSLYKKGLYSVDEDEWPEEHQALTPGESEPKVNWEAWSNVAAKIRSVKRTLKVTGGKS